MRAKLEDGVINLIPTNFKEKEFFSRIIGMKMQPVNDILTEDGMTLINFKGIRLFCQVTNNGTEFDNVSIEQ